VRLRPVFRRFVPFLRYTFPNLSRLRKWSQLEDSGTLVLVHGRWDELVPFYQCEILRKNVEMSAHERRRVVCIAIEHANHNDIIEESWSEVTAILNSEILTREGSVGKS